MKVLNKDELHVAEQVLLKHLPKSYKVYGFLFGLNRGKPTTQEIVVDSWPDFRLILSRPDKNKHTQEFMKKVTVFCMDEVVLRRVLREENAIDWSTYFLVGGLDITHEPVFKEVSTGKKVNHRKYTLVHLLYLPDISFLLSSDVDSELESRISSLDLSHVDLVNKTWKFGGNVQGYSNIKNLISNFPTFCIVDVQGDPVAWILVYDYCALGMLYTLPEHRGKGYAKVLISAMAKKLHAEGFPVFCFIEDDNMVSYKLFTNLGFIEDSSYRAAWFEFNFGSDNKSSCTGKKVPCNKLAVCHMMILEDISELPSIDSSGLSLDSLNDSHLDLVNAMWKFGNNQGTAEMICSMIANFPSCCVLNAEGKPVSWILTYASCTMGMLYTLLDRRGKGYAKVLISSMAKKLHALGYPVLFHRGGEYGLVATLQKHELH